MIARSMSRFFQYLFIALLSFGTVFTALAQSDKDFPPKPEPIHYVNDLAGMLQSGEDAQLEAKLRQYEEQTSTQVTIVTIKNLGGYDIAQYAAELGNRWGIGQKGKNNGVLILASLDDHKVNISPGYGLEGALTDAQCGRIIRNEMVPSFKQNNYYAGFDKAADAIIAATKGEYKPDEAKERKKKGSPGGSAVLILIILVIVFIISRRGGGGGGGSYMSGRGSRDLLTGAILGSLLGGGGRGGGGGWGGGSSGGGWGGGGSFGGGSFGGGGASGSW